MDQEKYCIGLVEGFLIGANAPVQIIDAVRGLISTTTPAPIKSLPDVRSIQSKANNALLEKEAARAEAEQAKPEYKDEIIEDTPKKPRKPFSPAELERRRKQLATARSKRKKKGESAPRDPHTRDMFPEKN